MVPGLFHFHPIGRFADDEALSPERPDFANDRGGGGFGVLESLDEIGSAFAAGTLMRRPPEVWAS